MKNLFNALTGQKVNTYSWKKFKEYNLYRHYPLPSTRVVFIHDLSKESPINGESIQVYVERIQFQGIILIDARDQNYNDCIIMVIVEQSEA